MRNARTQKLLGTLLTLALVLPLAGCMLEAEEEHPGDVDAVEALLEGGGCTLRASAPFRGTRFIDGVAHDAVIGRASVGGCRSSTTIAVTAILWQGGGEAGFSDTVCNNAYGCIAEVWVPYSPGYYATEGVSGQAFPDDVVSAGRNL